MATLTTPLPAKPTGFAPIFGWRRVIVALAVAAVLGLVISPAFGGLSVQRTVGREMVLALGPLVAFGVFEQWPRRLPAWIARWALQVLAVAVSIPLAVLALYL